MNAGPAGRTIASAAGEALRRRSGEYREDEWGFDREFAEAALPALDLLYRRWWRVQPRASSTSPATGARCSSPTTPGCFPSTPR